MEPPVGYLNEYRKEGSKEVNGLHKKKGTNTRNAQTCLDSEW